MSEDETSDYWWVGVLCSLVACFGTVSGMLLQKWSHMQNDKLPENERKPMYKRPLWWTSLFLMIIVPSPLDVLALALAPQTLLAPLAAVTLLLNALLSPCFLKETLTTIDKISTVLIFIGATVSTTFGSHVAVTHDVPGFYKLYERKEFIIFQVLAVAALISLWVFIKRVVPIHEEIEKRRKERARSGSHDSAGSGSVIGYVQVGEEPLAVRSLPFAYGLLAGLAGAQQMVVTKSCSELLTASFKGDNQFVYLLTYILTAAAVGFAMFQIGYLSKGLEHFDAIFFLPIYNAFLIVLSIIAGAIYFDEIRSVTGSQIALFLTGVSITLGGVLLLSKRNAVLFETKATEEQDDGTATVSLLHSSSSALNISDAEPDDHTVTIYAGSLKSTKRELAENDAL